MGALRGLAPSGLAPSSLSSPLGLQPMQMQQHPMGMEAGFLPPPGLVIPQQQQQGRQMMTHQDLEQRMMQQQTLDQMQQQQLPRILPLLPPAPPIVQEDRNAKLKRAFDQLTALGLSKPECAKVAGAMGKVGTFELSYFQIRGAPLLVQNGCPSEVADKFVRAAVRAVAPQAAGAVVATAPPPVQASVPEAIGEISFGFLPGAAAAEARASTPALDAKFSFGFTTSSVTAAPSGALGDSKVAATVPMKNSNPLPAPPPPPPPPPLPPPPPRGRSSLAAAEFYASASAAMNTSSNPMGPFDGTLAKLLAECFAGYLSGNDAVRCARRCQEEEVDLPSLRKCSEEELKGILREVGIPAPLPKAVATLCSKLGIQTASDAARANGGTKAATAGVAAGARLFGNAGAVATASTGGTLDGSGGAGGGKKKGTAPSVGDPDDRLPETLSELLKILCIEKEMGLALAGVRVMSIEDLNVEDPRAMLEPLHGSVNNKTRKKLSRWISERSHLYARSKWATNSSPAERMAKAYERYQQKGGGGNGGAGNAGGRGGGGGGGGSGSKISVVAPAAATAAAAAEEEEEEEDPALREWRNGPVDESEPPDILCDKISFELFEDPVRASDGQVYERDFIVDYIADKSKTVDGYKKKLVEMDKRGGGKPEERKDLEDKLNDGIESPMGMGRLKSLALRPARDVLREVLAFKRAIKGEPIDEEEGAAVQPPSTTVEGKEGAASTAHATASASVAVAPPIKQLEDGLVAVLKELYSHRDPSLVNIIGDALLAVGIASVGAASRLKDEQLVEAGVKKGPRMSLMKWAKANRPAAWEV